MEYCKGDKQVIINLEVLVDRTGSDNVPIVNVPPTPITIFPLTSKYDDTDVENFNIPLELTHIVPGNVPEPTNPTVTVVVVLTPADVYCPDIIKASPVTGTCDVVVIKALLGFVVVVV
jgi:hypothetical protein